MLFFLAGEKIEIDVEPASSSIMKENVEKILQFISAKKIRLHHVAAKGTLLSSGRVKITIIKDQRVQEKLYGVRINVHELV